MNSNFLTLCFHLVILLQWTSADSEMNTWFNDARYYNLSHVLNSPRLGTRDFNNSQTEKELALLNLVSGHWTSRVPGECLRHQQMVRDGVAENEEWALRFLDASAKWTNGFMTGNLVQPGSFDDCLRLLGPFRAFRGQHCLIEIDLMAPGLGFTAPVNPMISMLLHSLDKGQQLQWGVCTPSTCESADVLASVVEGFNAAFPNNGSIVASVLHCGSYKDSPTFSTADYVAIGIFSFFGLVIVSSTAYDLLTIEAEDRAVVLTSFSFYSNGRVLLSPAVDVLPALHGVRVLTRIWDQIGKLYLIDNIGPAVNSEILDEFYSDWPHVFITNPSFAIDSISFLSGCLVGFNFMKERALGIRFSLAHFYFKRYVRFTCPYAAILLMQSTLLLHLDSGPIWLEKVVPLQEKCRESWYTGIIYLGNYILTDRQCFSQVWFNCAEMQMFWLSPLLLFPLWKRPRWGKALVVALVVLGLVITFLVAFVNQVPVGNMSPNGKGALVFLPTHTRYPSWIIGLLTGCLLQDAETSPSTLTPGQVKLGWVVSMGLILIPVMGSHVFQQPNSGYNPVTHSLFISLTRPAFTIGLSFVVYACITGHGGPVNTILSWSFFRVTSRVMYSFYLSHTSVLFFLGARSRTPMYITDTTLLVLEVAYFFITWACSMLLCLTFEMPFVIIEQHYLGKTGHPKPAARSHSTMVRPSRSSGGRLQTSSSMSLDRHTSEVTSGHRTVPVPFTPGASLSSIDNPSTIVWHDSVNDMRAADPSSTDHLLTVVRKRLAKRFGSRLSPEESSSGSALQLHRPSSRAVISRSRLTPEEVEARKAAEAGVRVGTDVDVLEQEDGNLKQLQRARAAPSSVKLRTRREDHERGTADLDVYQDYDEERELAEEKYFRQHGIAMSESERSMMTPSRSRSVVRFSDETDPGSEGAKRATSRLRQDSTSRHELPAFTEEAGPSRVSPRREKERLEEEAIRERKREEEEIRMEVRRKREEKRRQDEYAKLAEQARLEEERRQRSRDDDEDEKENKSEVDERKKSEEKLKRTIEEVPKIEEKPGVGEVSEQGEERELKVEDIAEGQSTSKENVRSEEDIKTPVEEESQKIAAVQIKKTEEQAKREENAKAVEEEKQKREEELARKAEEDRRKEEEKRKLAEEEKKRKDEEKRMRDEELARKEEERKRLAEEDRKRKEEEKRKRDEELAKREEERKRIAEETRKKKEEEKRKKDEEAAKKEEERKRLAEEDKKKKEEEKRKRDEEAAKKEEERKKKEAERKRKAEEESQSGAGPSRPPGGADPGGNQDGTDPGTNTSHWLNAFRRL